MNSWVPPSEVHSNPFQYSSKRSVMLLCQLFFGIISSKDRIRVRSTGALKNNPMPIHPFSERVGSKACPLFRALVGRFFIFSPSIHVTTLSWRWNSRIQCPWTFLWEFDRSTVPRAMGSFIVIPFARVAFALYWEIVRVQFSIFLLFIFPNASWPASICLLGT